jgi:hypothetical protein
MSAFRDVKPAARVEPEAVRVSEPEPLGLVAPVIEITPADRSASEPEPEGTNEPEGTEAPPGRAHGRRAVRVEHRWRLLRAIRPLADDPPAVAPFEPDAAPLVDEVVPEPVVVIPDPEPEPVVIAEPEPVVVAEPEPAVVAEPEPEPVVIAEPEPEPVVVITEPEGEAVVATEPVVAAEPERARKSRWNPASIAPRDAADWQSSTSLWARRVFDAGSKPPPAVSWPRPHEPAVGNGVVRADTDPEVAEPAPAE